MRPLHCPRFARTRPLAVLFGGMFAAAAVFAQPVETNTNMVAGTTIVLGTKTPLGDAAISLPPGTAITNFEIVGEKAVVRQGPFTATLNLSELRQESAAAPTPAAVPSPEAAVGEIAAETPAPSPTPMQSQPAATPADNSTPAAPQPAIQLPDWVAPAVGGALVAYAVFATFALSRSRRRPRRAAPLAKSETDNAPVVILPSKTAAKPAVVADGGRAIACPLCGKNIPLDKVGRGRNNCPTCHEKFVVE